MADGAVRVLLIEDDDDDYVLAKDLFRELPRGAYHLDRVADYTSALEALEAGGHDVYLIDYRLGQRTGLELIEEARRRGSNAPLIMLTGLQEHEVDLKAMQLGAVDYLVKDRLDASALERSMRYALMKKRHEEQIRRVNQELELRVQERTAELERLNAALQREIVERKRAEEAVREASQRKDEFLATLAHELRNPLAAISSALQLLHPLPADAAQLAELHQIMRRQVEQLVHLIDDLMDMSRISRGKLQLRRERVALDDTVHAALDVSRPFIDAGRHHLQVSMSPQPIFVDGDAVRIAQVIGNLLVNAAKYTPPGGTISLKVDVADDQAVISVRDNGIGIPPQMLPKIFELFTQVDSSKTRSHGGLGIGLTLVKTLIEMHGGSVEARSEGAGHGAEFIVRLPLAASRADDPPRPPLPAPIQRPRPQRRKVLIVDDNESAAYLLQRLLERLDQDVIRVHSALEALAILPDVSPDVVISDIGMPEMSGYDLARAIRERNEMPQPVLIAVTGYGNDHDRQEAARAGFDHHLCKPVSLRDLEVLLDAAIPTGG